MSSPMVCRAIRTSARSWAKLLRAGDSPPGRRAALRSPRAASLALGSGGRRRSRQDVAHAPPRRAGRDRKTRGPPMRVAHCPRVARPVPLPSGARDRGPTAPPRQRHAPLPRRRRTPRVPLRDLRSGHSQRDPADRKRRNPARPPAHTLQQCASIESARHCSSCVRCSASRRANAISVSVGFAEPEVGKTELPATERFAMP